MAIQSKKDAQARVEQINAFNAELDALENENIITLDAGQHAALERYHKGVLGKLQSVHDVDINTTEQQLSLGMKFASLIGALALSASLFFFFYRYWGYVSLGLQTVILIAAPLVGLAATAYISQKERTGYFSKILSFLTLVAFALNITILEKQFNMSLAQSTYGLLGLFAFALAYAVDARLLLIAGIGGIAVFMSAQAVVLFGGYWTAFFYRPESVFPTVVLFFLLSYLPHRKLSDYPKTYRVFGMFILMVALWILSNWGAMSALDFAPDTIETVYETAGFVLSAAGIALGIRKQWPEVSSMGNIFFLLFMYTRFYHWCWDWMPRELFFLIIGLSAVMILLVFKKWRISRLLRLNKDQA